MTHNFPAIFAIGVTLCLSSKLDAINLVITDTGDSPGDIQLSIDAFRTVLGALNPSDPGGMADGRREVNWDAVPDFLSAPNDFPGDYFNGDASPLARGLSLSTPGTGFQVSATAASGTPPEFANLDAAFSADFQPFSEERLFTPLGSIITRASFFVPGTGIPAFTDGFGAVFTGVEANQTSRINFYDRNDQLIISEFVPEGGPGSLSFLGVVFDEAKVMRVEIISGEVPLDFGGAGDRVALDDFIYGEPQAIPEPSAPVLLLVAGTLCAVRRRRKR